MDYLTARGISCGVHYPTPIHLQECYEWLGIKRGSLPVTERVSSTVLSLPMYPEIESSQIEYVCSAIKEFARKHH